MFIRRPVICIMRSVQSIQIAETCIMRSVQSIQLAPSDMHYEVSAINSDSAQRHALCVQCIQFK